MAEIHEVPWQQSPAQLVSQYYFYSDYNPVEHFTYNIAFQENGTDPDIETTNENKRKAFAKAIEYHFSFEQVFPKEQEDFITLYVPKLDNNNNLIDFDFGAKNKYKLMTKIQFENQYLTYLTKLNTLSKNFYDVADERNMEYDDYKDRSLNDLKDLYNMWTQQAGYENATLINQHCYDTALYCKIYRPQKFGSSEYVSPYEFRRVLRMVNKIFNFKLPVEEGWYMYNKQTKKWELIEFKEEVSSQ